MRKGSFNTVNTHLMHCLGAFDGIKCLVQLISLTQVLLHLRVHGHGGEFSVDISAGCCSGVTGEGLGRRHLVPPAELQRRAAVYLFDLWQVRLCCNHHTRGLAVHEILLR